MKRAIFLPAKAPRPGRVKTRLTPPLTPAEAAAVYRGFLQDTLALAVGLGWECVAVTHSETPDVERLLSALVPPRIHLLPRPGAEFGAILSGGFADHFDGGFDRVVLIGSDNPTLPKCIVEDAIDALDDHDLVIGPTVDGGYYLLGLTRQRPSLFEGIAWSTNLVFDQTLARAGELGLRVAAAPEWYDIDTVTDLERVRAELVQLSSDVAPATRAVLAALRW